MANTTLIQVSAVAIDGRALMIEGAPGSGKSSLALALIDRGAVLIGDDGVELSLQSDARPAHIVVSPPPHIAGKLEIRNIGIVDMPTATAPLALILSLCNDAPRFCESAETRRLLGFNIPALPFTPGTIAPAERALWALKTHGRAHGLAFPPP